MVIVITGPTGTGKTELGLFLADKLNGEIINADSTQVYKGMDIATNKVKDTKGVVHHLLDIIPLEEDYTVYDYQRDARRIIDDIIAKGKTPILVGGTGLYIKAVLYDYKFAEKENNSYDNYSNEEVYNKLLEVDPNTTIHKNNRKRVVSALNYYMANNKPYSKKEITDKLLYDTIFIGLTTDRITLYNKIDSRVDNMVEEGLIEEAKQIYDSNVRTKAVMTPIGYKELFDYFENKKELNECLELIKQRSRNYAKRQFTWFNNQMNLKWFNVDYSDFSKTENEILEYIKKHQ